MPAREIIIRGCAILALGLNLGCGGPTCEEWEWDFEGIYQGQAGEFVLTGEEQGLYPVGNTGCPESFHGHPLLECSVKNVSCVCER